MGLYYKIHRSKYGIMLAVCDKDICGKRLDDKSKKIEFFVNPRFYKEESGTKKDIKGLLDNAADANLVGKEAVSLGIELGVIKEENVTKIAGVPHAIYSVMLS